MDKNNSTFLLHGRLFLQIFDQQAVHVCELALGGPAVCMQGWKLLSCSHSQESGQRYVIGRTTVNNESEAWFACWLNFWLWLQLQSFRCSCTDGSLVTWPLRPNAGKPTCIIFPHKVGLLFLLQDMITKGMLLKGWFASHQAVHCILTAYKALGKKLNLAIFSVL